MKKIQNINLTQSGFMSIRQDEANEEIIINIINDIIETQKINKKIYEQILEKSPQYYKKLRQTNYQCQGFDYKDIRKKYLLIRQLDNLLEEKNQLNAQLNQLQLKQVQQNYFKQIRFEKECNLYAFLRSIWKRKFTQLCAQDRIQKISKSVAYIKGHVQSLLKKETQSTITYHQAIQKSEQYNQLLHKYENLIMQKEDFQSQINCHRQQYSQLNIYSQGLKIQNNKLIKEIDFLKEKNRNLEKKEMKTQMKISTLEEQLYNKSKQLDKINREKKYIFIHPNYSIHVFTKEHLQKQQLHIKKELQDILQYLKQDLQEKELSCHNNSIVLSDSKSVTNLLQQVNGISSQIKKRLNMLQVPIAPSSRTVKTKQKSIIMESQAKKARFVRQSSRNSRQNSVEKAKNGIFIKSQTFLQKI